MAKKRISITLKEELVEKVDSESSKNNLNRSQMVESILEGYFDDMGIDTAVIFCGDPEAKSLRDFRGEPVLKRVLEGLDGFVSRVILLAGDNRDDIENIFGSSYRDIALEYVSDESEGTAAALEKVEGRIGGTFLALNGHVVSDVDLHEMVEVHRDEDKTATMALTTVESPSEYGVAKLKGRTILGFEEKPEPGEEPSRLINAGTYILEPEIFDELDEKSIEDVFEELSRRRELTGYIYGGKWKEVSQE